MGFTIPNLDDAAFEPHAGIDAVDFEILAAGHLGTGVVSGCAVSPKTPTPDMSVVVAAGEVAVAGVTRAVAGGTVTITAAHASNPRFDLILANGTTGAVSAQAGVPAPVGTGLTGPVFPAIPGGSVALAAVYIPPADTAIQANQIVDKRVMLADPDSDGAALAAHEADTTGVHGIADTSDLILEGDPRLTDAREPTAHDHDADDVTSGVLARARLPQVAGLLHKLDATAPPTAGDDSDDGYGVGSLWVDVSADAAWVCVDASPGAAVWRQVADSLARPTGPVPMLRDAPHRDAEMIAPAFFTGHGWTNTGLGTVSLESTNTYALGDRCVFITTNGAGGWASVDHTGPFDLTGKELVVWVRTAATFKVAECELLLGDDALANYYRLPWILDPAGGGDSAANSLIRAHEWFALTVNFQDAIATGAPDRAAIERIRFRVRDTNSVNQVYLGGVAARPLSERFPNGALTFWFDDGYANNYTAARPALDRYGFPATLSVIRERVGTAGHLTLDQIRALQDLSGWEIALHADTEAVHTADFTNISAAAQIADLKAQQKWLADRGLRGYLTTAYPKGAYNPVEGAASNTHAQMRQHVVAARGTWDRGRETLPPADPLRLRQKYVVRTTTPASLEPLIDAAHAERGWLILTFHSIIAGAASTIEYTPANLAAIAAYAASVGIPVMTCGDVMRALAA